MPGHAAVAAQQLPVHDGRASDARAQGEHEHVLVAGRRAPDHLAGQRHARIVIREDRDIERHAHHFAEQLALQKVQRARQG